MLDFLACQSAEKLVVDAEAVGMALRLVEGIQVHTDTLAQEMFESIGFRGDFLKQKITRQLFPKEQYLPSAVLERGSIRAWEEGGRLDTFARAKARVRELLAAYQRPPMDPDQERELRSMVERLARHAGMDSLPPL